MSYCYECNSFQCSCNKEKEEDKSFLFTKKEFYKNDCITCGNTGWMKDPYCPGAMFPCSCEHGRNAFSA